MAKNIYNSDLAASLKWYANSRTLDFHQYSPYHMRIIDADYTILDCWTSNKYWIMKTSYCEQSNNSVVERGGEKGILPLKYKKLEKLLDGIFYAAYES